MFLTSLTLDAPGQLMNTHLVADEDAAIGKLRELFPQATLTVPDDEVVHTLGEHGVRVQIRQQDVADLIARQAPDAAEPGPSAYGDLFRYTTYVPVGDARRGEFMRPATALEAAFSRSCALLDGGLGVFGVHAIGQNEQRPPTGPGAWRQSQAAFLHFGTPEWGQALLTSNVRYYRVGAIPHDADLPSITLPHVVANPA